MITYSLYTDGSCLKNPGNGGYAFLLMKDGKKLYDKFGSETSTTNNRMELTAVIEGIKKFISYYSILDNPITLNIYSDSQYICKAFNENWSDNWVLREFKGIKNPDLWRTLLELLIIIKEVEVNFIWVKGHDGNEFNEYVDKLALKAAKTIKE